MREFLSGWSSFSSKYLYWVTIPDINFVDIAEIIIIAFLIYRVLVWANNTRAKIIFKGIGVVLAFILLAAFFHMNTILWLVEKAINVGIIAIIIVFQPELRGALEQLGRKNYITTLFSFDNQKNVDERFSDKTISEIIKATYEMGKAKTGALIIIENQENMDVYARTGIMVDGCVTSQLLINIFEHNTPLHDGAVIIRGDRVLAATCYLPLTDNSMLSKDLGTRHRAAVGISEVTDSLTIVASEETGMISAAIGGVLHHDIKPEKLREKMEEIQNKHVEAPQRFKPWKRRAKSDEQTGVEKMDK